MLFIIYYIAYDYLNDLASLKSLEIKAPNASAAAEVAKQKYSVFDTSAIVPHYCRLTEDQQKQIEEAEQKLYNELF